MKIISKPHGGDNMPKIETTTTQATTSRTVTRRNDCDPPAVLIDLQMVGQMRRKKQMIAAIGEWEAARQAGMAAGGRVR